MRKVSRGLASGVPLSWGGHFVMKLLFSKRIVCSRSPAAKFFSAALRSLVKNNVDDEDVLKCDRACSADTKPTPWTPYRWADNHGSGYSLTFERTATWQRSIANCFLWLLGSPLMG